MAGLNINAVRKLPFYLAEKSATSMFLQQKQIITGTSRDLEQRFMTRPGLSLRYPKEQPIIASASGFNRRQMDKTGLGTVQTPKRVITVKGKRSVAE